jgi:hypothetical protein
MPQKTGGRKMRGLKRYDCEYIAKHRAKNNPITIPVYELEGYVIGMDENEYGDYVKYSDVENYFQEAGDANKTD